MRTLLPILFLSVLLCSCGNFARVSSTGEVTVQQGLLSSIQASTVQITPGVNGGPPTITMTQTGYDGTAVPDNITGTVGTVGVATSAEKGLASTNAKDVKLGHQGVQNNAITHPVTSTTNVIGPNGGSKATSTTTVPFPSGP